jgi:hypothetical protein
MKSDVKCPSCEADAGEDFIIMHSGVNHEGKGFVHLAHGREMRVQFTPKECREHALRLLEAAEAAESDAAVLRLLEEKILLDRPRAVSVIADLRNYRDDRYRKPNEHPEGRDP